ncbi:PDR/VanB family oxidoreductase [Rhodococcus daqingensis]|uniref:PDR/VanB family oxidoreductase n=1 Tax=Rhodococcus daqingensis TaxID=2479363 RepID=A0ABW2S407_9NOCA
MLLLLLGYDAINWFDGRFSLPTPGMLAAPCEFIDVVVTERAAVTGDQSAVAITFAAPDGSPLPAWSAGAHIDVTLPSGTVRQYSLCGDPTDQSSYRIAVRLIQDGRGGSAEVHSALTVGTEFQVARPRNAFPLAVGGYNQTTSAVRLIAGGIGVTPILPMLDMLDRTATPWSMIYCGRTRDSLAFLSELARFGDRVTIHEDATYGPASAEELLGDLTVSSAVYTCGPPPMIDALRAALVDRPDVEFHYERFSLAPVVDGREFDLRFASSGEVVRVAADQTALSAILGARPDATYSCQQGFCRSCAVRVLDGAPEHRSTALSPGELDAGYFLPCVSRSEGCLTIDM